MEEHRTFPKAGTRKRHGAKSEAPLQAFADDYLAVLRIPNIRIPDGFWAWITYACNALKAWGKLKEIRSRFGGIPDNTCFIPISDKYSLCLHLELKSKSGDLHGEQKTQAMILPWQIARTTDEIQELIDTFREDAKELKEIWHREK